MAVRIAAAAIDVPAALDALAGGDVAGLFAQARSLVETVTSMEASAAREIIRRSREPLAM